MESILTKTSEKMNGYMSKRKKFSLVKDFFANAHDIGITEYDHKLHIEKPNLKTVGCSPRYRQLDTA